MIATLIALLSGLVVASPTLSQQVCDISCGRNHAAFSGCESSQLERNRRDTVGLTGRIITVGAGAYCKQHATVEVLKASAGVPSRIEVAFFAWCTGWSPQGGEIVNLRVWERASPTTGAYDLAPCAD